MIRNLLLTVFLLPCLLSCATDRPATDVEPPDTGSGSGANASIETTSRSAAPVDEDVMYSVFAAELLGNEGDLEGAVGAYLEAAMESDDPAIAMRATRVAFAAQAWQQAAMAADRWAVLDPDNLSAHESAALAQLATMDYASAEFQLLEILRLSEDKEAAWAQIARLLGRSPSPEKAAKVLDTLLAQSGDASSSIGVYTQSQLALRAGEPDRAYALARQAVDLSPNRIEFLAWAGQLALNRGDSVAALGYIRRAWEQEPDDHDLTLAYADLLARSGDEEAARTLMAEMEQTPDVMLSRILFELTAGEQQAANALYGQFRDMTFEDPNEATYYLAQAAEALGRSEEAIELYSTIGEGDFAVASKVRRAEILAGAGDIAGARALLAELRTGSDSEVIEEAWLTEARILQQSGDRESAIKVLEEALQQSSTSISLRYARALVAAESGDVELAESDLRVILTEQPDNAAALNALGYTLADQTERFVEAEQLIRQAYVLQPGDPSIIDSMGWVTYRLGRLEEAESFLRQAWNLDKNPEIGAHLGEVLWMLGRREEAVEVWKHALDTDDSNPALLDTIRRLNPAPE